MKHHFFKKCCALLALLTCAIGTANAAIITTEFSSIINNQGSVDIWLTTNNNAEIIPGLTFYFSENFFSDLSIISSPAAWDSIIAQPDVFLGAGFFDSFNASGLQTGHAKIAFTYLSQTSPDVLWFDIYNENFDVIASGISTAVVSANVPEPSPVILLCVGLLLLSVGNHYRVTNNNTGVARA